MTVASTSLQTLLFGIDGEGRTRFGQRKATPPDHLKGSPGSYASPIHYRCTRYWDKYCNTPEYATAGAVHSFAEGIVVSRNCYLLMEQSDVLVFERYVRVYCMDI